MGLGLAASLAIGSAGLQVFGGIQAAKEGERQAAQVQAETREQKQAKKEEVQRQISRNVTLFAKSGVSLAGSPLFNLEQSSIAGQEDIRSLQRSGAAQASGLRRSGRSAFLGSIAGATGTLAGANLGSSKRPTPKKAPKKTPKKTPKKKDK